MAKYVYPGVFTPEDMGGYSVFFPDLQGCYTCGDDIADAMEMAEDALCLFLYSCESDGKALPKASQIQEIIPENSGQFVTLIHCDTLQYSRFYNKQTVKRTVNLPKWLNDLAKENHISISETLQDSLAAQLGVSLS